MFATTLTTERLTLRPPRLEDARPLLERYAGDPRVTRYMSWRTVATLEEERAFLVQNAMRREAGEDYQWAICVGDDPHPSGMIGLVPKPLRAELGYALAHTHWGRGLMTEATRAVLAEAWRCDRLWRVDAWVHVENAASARVLEKCGLRSEGVQRRRVVMPQLGEAPQDCFMYAQVRDDIA